MKSLCTRQTGFLCALLLACPILAEAQKGLTNQVYAGGSYVRTDDDPNVNGLGWETSYSEYPYASSLWRWIGGSIEANGVYAAPLVLVDGQTVSGLLQNQIYTFMGGPTVRTRSFRHVQPSAHVLLGAVLTNVDTTGKGTAFFGKALSDSKTTFGLAFGGGVDYPLSRMYAVRGNIDWLRSTYRDEGIDRQNSLRTSIGIVVKF